MGQGRLLAEQIAEQLGGVIVPSWNCRGLVEPDSGKTAISQGIAKAPTRAYRGLEQVNSWAPEKDYVAGAFLALRKDSVASCIARVKAVVCEPRARSNNRSD